MKITSVAKYIDQPLIINKISKVSPILLLGGALGLCVNNSLNNKKEGEPFNSSLYKNTTILSLVCGASLLASKGLKFKDKRIFGGLIDIEAKKDILAKQKKVIKEFVENSDLSGTKLYDILQNAKHRELSLKETDYVYTLLKRNSNAKKLLDTLFGKKENMTSSEIFSEIGRLSLLGLVPVAAGVGAGCLVDSSSNKAFNNCNRLKEGFYQYFANIFLCNVGAGAALFGLEGLKKINIIKELTPVKKFSAMLLGIIMMGVLGGSFIANYISKKIIDPLILKKDAQRLTLGGIYDERKPESLDMAMHIDDIATAGVLSGLKWIEPMLPIFYMFSGYRAGLGYRNSGHTK